MQLLNHDFRIAVSILNGEYWDKTSSPDPLLKKHKDNLSALNAGDSLELGTYSLPGSHKPSNCCVKSPIIWRVIKKNRNRLLLLSEHCLDWEPYQADALYSTLFLKETYDDVYPTWENAYIRKKLNKEYYKEWFLPEEQRLIVQTRITPSLNPKHRMRRGRGTRDYLFFLGIEDLPDGFDGQAKLIYADENDTSGVIELSSYFSSWWLRTPGYRKNDIACYNEEGELDLDGDISTLDEIGIRPAIWIDIDLIDTLMLHSKTKSLK